MKFSKRIASVFLAGVVLAGATGCEGSITIDGKPVQIPGVTSSAGVTTPASTELADTNVDSAAALQKLESIRVAGRAPKTGYDRDNFGPAWADVDHNGCDTRNDILERDLINETYKDGTKECVVATGTLHDDYTGATINFVRGQDTSSAVQIDHLVALSEAWQKGAQQWDAETRKQFSNDPINLKAVDGPSNSSKGDKDLATWLPDNRGHWCEYTSNIIDVKAKYGVWMTQAEHDKAKEILSTCK